MNLTNEIVELYNTTTNHVRYQFDQSQGKTIGDTIHNMIQSRQVSLEEMFKLLKQFDSEDICTCHNPIMYKGKPDEHCTQYPIGTCMECFKMVRLRPVSFRTIIKTKGPNKNGHVYSDEGLQRLVDLANNKPVNYIVLGQCKPKNDCVEIMSVAMDKVIGTVKDLNIEDGCVIGKVTLAPSTPLMTEVDRDKIVRDVELDVSCFGPRLITTSSPKSEVRDVIDLISFDYVPNVSHTNHLFIDYKVGELCTKH